MPATDRLDAREISRLICYNPETGVFTYKPRDGDNSFNAKIAGKHAGRRRSDGYVTVKLYGRHYQAARLAWACMKGEWPPGEVDHINGVPSDNRMENLRQATHQQNAMNRRRRSDNTSGYKGVSFNKQAGKWQATICISGRNCYLGLFASAEEAAAAYQAAAPQFHDQFARVA